TQRSLGHRLQVAVQMQRQVLAGERFSAAEHAQYAPAGIGLDLFITHGAVQQLLIETLYPGLTDIVRSGIGHRVDALLLALVDPTDIAHRVGKMFRLRLMPNKARLHVDTGQPELVHGDARNLLLGQAEHHRHRLEGPPGLLQAPAQLLDVLVAQFQYFAQQGNGGVQIGGAFAGNAQAETGSIIRQHQPVAVVDAAARRWDRLHVHTVVLGQCRVVFVLHYLQPIQARQQAATQQRNEQHGKNQPALYYT